MRKKLLLSLFVALGLTASPASALYEGLQCVPFARAMTGVTIYGDAHTWWEQAENRYERGNLPKVGAVMTFIPHGNMRLGHVAAVRKIIDKRTLLISHANWSTIDGIRGHIEEDVRVIDVSEDNDWSRVRVWYTPNGALGGNEWPLHGFIYPSKVRKEKEARAALAAVLARTPPARPSSQQAIFKEEGPERPTARIASAQTVQKPPKGQTRTNGQIQTKSKGFALSPRLLAELDKAEDFALSSSLLAEIDTAAKKEKKRNRKS
jgi:surface antigen